MRILRAGAHPEVPWKNGLGVSQVLATQPAGAGYDTLDWQVASTAFADDCPFSSLNGLDRLFMLLEGDGVELTCADGGSRVDRQLRVDRPYVAHAFSGDWRTQCRMLGGRVRVLNVVWRRDRVRASLATVHFADAHALVQSPGEVLVAVLLDGLAQLAGVQPGLSRLDGVLLEDAVGARVELRAAAGARVAVVRLSAA